MAGGGYKNWTAGDIPTANEVDTLWQEQTIMNFDDAASRDTALSVVKAEAMAASLDDVNGLSFYSGSAWSTFGPLWGQLTSWTPTVTQSGSVTVTNEYSRYQRNGRMISGFFHVAVTGSGTGANAISIGGLPFAAHATAGSIAIGMGQIYDLSANANYAGAVYLASTTAFDLRSPVTASVDNRLGIATFTAGLASGDCIGGSFMFEAAADA